ncbi:MAG: Ig-like domain-containing protein [Clostridia bacterium]|nr:Ig-like domain-containing protein [Clostridia bacterium]
MKKNVLSVFVALMLAIALTAGCILPLPSALATQVQSVGTIAFAQDVSACPQNAVDLAWNAVEGAACYNIYLYEEGGWELLTSETATTKRIEALEDGAELFFRVQAADADGNVLASSDVLTAYTAPAAPIIKSAVLAKGMCSLAWEPVNGADGYKVFAGTVCLADVHTNQYGFSADLLTNGSVSVCAYRYISGIACNGAAAEAVFTAENAGASITLGVGETVDLSAWAFEATTYLTADAQTVSISADGVITAEKCGRTQVIVRTAAGDVYVHVTVLPAPASVAFAEPNKQMYVGESEVCALLLNGAGAFARNYKSSDTTVVKVNANGALTALKAGSATITATLYNDVAAQMNITVVSEKALAFEKTTLTLGVGEQIKNPVLSEATVQKNVRYSGFGSVVKVSADGTVTALQEGTVTLKATATDGRTATCTVNVVNAPQELTLSRTDSEIGVGVKLQLTAQADTAIDLSRVVWSSDNSAVASVENGIVTARATGTATISAVAYNGIKATCHITVLAAPVKLKLNKTSHSLYVGDTHILTASAEVDAYLGKLSFASSDKSVLTVDENGKVTAVKAGTATVTVTAYNGICASCTYAVSERATKVTVTASVTTFAVGMYVRMTATTDTGKGLEGAVWTVSDESIAYLNEEHHLIAKKPGKVTVTVTLTNGVKGSCTVTIQAAPTSITLDKTSMTLDVDARYRLKATVNSGAYASAITFSSTDAAIARVAADGTVIAVSPGTVTITASTFNGKKATCTVTVRTVPTSISFSSSAYSVEQGAWFYVTVYDQNREKYDGATFTSSDKSIATVAADGLVHVLKMGTATITAKTSNGKTATCRINVTRMQVKLVSQLPDYPTGCEAASCAMLLGYYNYKYTTADMVSIIPRENIRYINGYPVGPDINEKFVGDPRCTYTSENPGYGVFSPAVTKALQTAVNRKGGKETAVCITGCSYNELLGYLADGYPVIVWSTYNMNVPSTVNEWYIDRGNGKYEYFSYPRGTHVTVLCGYDGSKIYMMDPYDNACLSFSSSTFKARWDLLGNQGVILK